MTTDVWTGDAGASALTAGCMHKLFVFRASANRHRCNLTCNYECGRQDTDMSF